MTGDGYIIVPIAIRESDTVRLHFPADITDDEAEKVARVMRAYAGSRATFASVDRSGEAGETRSEAKGLDPKDESAVPEGQTPTPSPFSGDPQ